jgi:hypothetical protein
MNTLIEKTLDRDKIVIRLKRLARDHPKKVIAAGRRVWARVDAKIQEAQASKKTRIAERLELLRTARRIVLGEEEYGEGRSPVDRRELDNFILTMHRYQAGDGNLKDVGEVDAYVVAMDASAYELEESSGRRGEQCHAQSRARIRAEFELETSDDGTARPAFRIAHDLRELLADFYMVRTGDEWWEIAVHVLLVGAPEMSESDLGIGAELTWGRWRNCGDADLFNHRDGIPAYVGLATRHSEHAEQDLVFWTMAERAVRQLEDLVGSESHVGRGEEQVPTSERVATACDAARDERSVPEDPEVESGAGRRDAGTHPWNAARKGRLPRRGWDEICDAIGAQTNRASVDRIKRLNELSDGPITWFGDTPEADTGELIAWIEDTRARDAAARELRTSRKAAGKELAERAGARAADLGFHHERRTNAGDQGSTA